MKFLDQARVFVKSGNGGAGSVSFRREKDIEFGGPDGGNGGRGGDVIIECVDGLNTLIDYRYQQHFKANNGRPGSGDNRSGEPLANIVRRLILTYSRGGNRDLLGVVSDVILGPHILTKQNQRGTIEIGRASCRERV